MAKVSAMYNRIHVLRERYYQAATGKEALIAEAEIPEQVYNSNAIENSTLTLDETEKLLLQIGLDRFISEREIFEVKNLARVVSWIDRKAKEQELSLDIMRTLHKMLIANIRDDIAGRFRASGEYVRVGSHIAPAPESIVDNLEQMLVAYLEGKKIMTLVDYAKSRKLSHSNLINKANRQTIEAFMEKGVWKIGAE